MKDQECIQEKGRSPRTSRNNEWQSAISSAFGAAVGVVAGSMTENAMASELEDSKIMEPHHVIMDNPIVNEEDIADNPSFSNEPTDVPEEPQQSLDPDIQVLSVEQVHVEGYGMINVADILVNGQQGMVFDLNNDNMADALVIDLNEDGTINENEAIDLSEEYIAMSDLAAAISPVPLHAVAPGTDILHANQDDYENQGDVQDYFA